MRIKLFVARLACVSLVATSLLVGIAGTAQADPNNGKTTTTSFFDCTGPPGTPSSFTAVREAAGSGFALTDGTSVFTVVIFDDVTTGVSFSPKGLSHSGNVTTTCTVISSISGDTLLLSGFLTPVG